ncbi:hypothetical protein Trydic_g403 [Trypoxylus dichotomus]
MPRSYSYRIEKDVACTKLDHGRLGIANDSGGGGGNARNQRPVERRDFGRPLKRWEESSINTMNNARRKTGYDLERKKKKLSGASA